jgi:hypothetical protein
MVLERERKAMGSGEEFSMSLKLNVLERAVRKVGGW